VTTTNSTAGIAAQLRPCLICGSNVIGPRSKKYCSKRCCWMAQDRKAGAAPMREYAAARRKPANWFKCQHCGKDAHRNMSGTNPGPNRWCSMQCRKDAAKDARPAPYSRCYGLYCRTCRAPFVSKTDKTHCSRTCELAAARAATLAAALAAHQEAARVNACECCGAQFCPLYGASHAALCGPCGLIRQREHKRTHRIARKARQRGAQVEAVNPMRVFERDGWRCKLCGIRTPRSKRGTQADDAPELDHIIPLSRNGEHSYRNTQCTCRKCNAEKSDRPLGQLLLIG